MKILITSAASTEAYQLKNKLAQSDAILGDYAELPTMMVKNGSMMILPNPADASYAHKMLTLCLDKEIETVYALQTAEFDLLNEASLLFSEYGITIFPASHAV